MTLYKPGMSSWSSINPVKVNACRDPERGPQLRELSFEWSAAHDQNMHAVVGWDDERRGFEQRIDAFARERAGRPCR